MISKLKILVSIKNWKKVKELKDSTIQKKVEPKFKIKFDKTKKLISNFKKETKNQIESNYLASKDALTSSKYLCYIASKAVILLSISKVNI